MGREEQVRPLSHASTDLQSRRLKAEKIRRLLALGDHRRKYWMLEVGTGSGAIANYFGTHPDIDCRVTSVDVVDERQTCDGYEFVLVEGTILPFADASFDIVVSNHVIEHVGAERAQRSHLIELKRVLNPDGVGYLATPNRWALMEPHYRLPFLSWLPPRSRVRYLRAVGRSRQYDCYPLSRRQLDTLIRECGWDSEHLEIEAIREGVKLHDLSGYLARIAATPSLGRFIGPLLPTFVHRLHAGNSPEAHGPTKQAER